jgi:hypothetical protein
VEDAAFDCDVDGSGAGREAGSVRLQAVVTGEHGTSGADVVSSVLEEAAFAAQHERMFGKDATSGG